MHQLVKVDGVRLEGFISQRLFLKAREKGANTIPVDINVYGKRENAFSVGNVLSSFGVDLQQPVCGLEDAAYYNPHFFHVEELLGLGPVHQTPLLKISAKVDTNTHGVESSVAATPEQDGNLDISTEINSVLRSLSHHAILSKKAGAVALKSQLKE